ncbi:MAG: Uma2 family endonuclease, partial [Armatimonadetes bacterium]|nr:Uma2 family endonuclease [Armatimonadota bacterium]
MTTVAAPVRRLSLDEFRRLPEGPPYCEREPDGELSEVSSATSRHNMLMALLFAMLHAFARLQKLGGVYLNTDVYLPSGRVYIPDLCFVAKEQGDLVGEDGKV